MARQIFYVQMRHHSFLTDDKEKVIAGKDIDCGNCNSPKRAFIDKDMAIYQLNSMFEMSKKNNDNVVEKFEDGTGYVSYKKDDRYFYSYRVCELSLLM